MSARRLDHSAFAAPVILHTQTTRLELSPSAVRIRKNGIEFHSQTPLNNWMEMTVVLETASNNGPRKLQCTGVVVDCQGNRHQGYRISLLFTDLSRQAQARLQELAFSQM